MMLTVGIKNFELWTSIGMYAEEEKVPTKLIFNIAIELPKYVDIFLDYTLIIAIIKDCCKEHVALLETLLHQILTKIRQLASGLIIHLSIEKCNPPTGDAIQSSYVTWQD